jgi:hypothetical protein
MFDVHEIPVSKLLEARLYEGDPKDVAFACASDVALLRSYLDAAACGSNQDPLAYCDGDNPGQRIQATHRPQVVMNAATTLLDLEHIFRRAFEGCSDFEVLVWSCLRLPLYESRTNFGEVQWRPYTRREVSQELRDVYGLKTPYYQVGRLASKLDERLYLELVRCEKVRC